MIRLIAVDLDGTLLDDDHMTVPERSRQALRRAAERGVQLAICSGRTLALLQNVLAQVPQIRYAVVSNGAAAADTATGERLFCQPFPQEKAQEILKILQEYPEVTVESYADGESWVQEKHLPILQEWAKPNGFWRHFLTRVHVVQNLAEELRRRQVEKITVSNMPPRRKEEILRRVGAGDDLSVSSSVENYMELNFRGVNKGLGLSSLCRRLGIAREEVMAVGDGDNDFDMMDWAGYSVAMKNGLPETKAHARYETEEINSRGGLGIAVERFVLEPGRLPPDDSALALAMAEYEQGCPRRIHHLMKVYAYAGVIARGEGFPQPLRRVVEAAALVHDIGIRPALETYVSDAGPLQETEGTAPARRMLSRLGYGLDVVERVAWLVGRHHSYENIQGDDWQALAEADFLVNIGENGLGAAEVASLREKIFRTKTGLALLDRLYGAL